uniref:Guanine nucleotide-binding protein alpha-2 subunit n=1 Tax=Anthurium amnicola TaxID=1678845 RepID=A0A1D1XID9_9ARAE
MEKLAKMMLPLGAPIPEAEAVEYSFAAEYDGPPVPYEIPRAIPIEIDRIPVASVASAPKSAAICVPVVQPLPSPEPLKRAPTAEEFDLVAEVAVSPTSVIAFEQTVVEGIDREMSGDTGSASSGRLGCSSNCQDRSRELSDGGLEAVGFSSEFKESVDFSNDTNAQLDRVTTESALSSEDFGFPSSASFDDEDDEVAVPPATTNARRGPLVSFRDAEEASETSHTGTDSTRQERREGSTPRVKRGSCYRCGRGNRFTEKEVCLVCDDKYCSSCVLRAMGSMPEGRKCVTCIGFPINESKRERLGKCSRMLKRLLSSLEIQQVMKAEKFCEANQLRPENVYVNRKQLCQEEMVLLQACANPPHKLKPGYYWYDKVSGFWGKEGHKPHQIISPHLNVGGNLTQDASNGNTGIFINNREITKAELRMLQWAGVQCAGCPHFWVNADGTYQEEGQKNIKGHLWGKAGMKLLCSILSLPVPGKETVILGEEVDNVNNIAIADYLQQRTLLKLLLIGCHGSGTSTIFKQTKFLYRPDPFSEEERESIKLTIQSNIYSYLGILLEGRERFEEESLAEIKRKQPQESAVVGNESNGCKGQTLYSIGPRLKAFSDWLLKVVESGNLEAIFPAATRVYAPLVEDLWNDAAIQATYDRRSELQLLPSSANYFLERVVDISRAEYEPSDTDILYADGITSFNGLACADFVFPQLACGPSGFDAEEQHETVIRYQLIRVHSKGLGENCKWLEMFEDVRMVMFCVAMSDYDEYCEDATGLITNKMLASKRLFEGIITHPTFEQIDFLLILNKYDLFEQKIEQVSLTLCDWFNDFNPVVSRHRQNSRALNNGASLPQQAFHYIAVKFKRLFASLTGRKLYVTMANSLDSDSVDNVLRYAREILKWEDERVMFGSSELEAYSTEPSSFSQ